MPKQKASADATTKASKSKTTKKIISIQHREIKATGKKQLLIAGVVTEVCVAFPALSALEEGYEVFVANDLDCAPNADYPWSDCAVLLGEREGEGSIPIHAF